MWYLLMFKPSPLLLLFLFPEPGRLVWWRGMLTHGVSLEIQEERSVFPLCKHLLVSRDHLSFAQLLSHDHRSVLWVTVSSPQHVFVGLRTLFSSYSNCVNSYFLSYFKRPVPRSRNRNRFASRSSSGFLSFSHGRMISLSLPLFQLPIICESPHPKCP